MALNEIIPEKRYVDYAVKWGTFHHWGFRSGNRTRNADDQCCAQTYVDLCRIKGDTMILSNAKMDFGLMTNSTKNDDWTWVDAIQMAMPAMAKLGSVEGDLTYFRKMMLLYQHTRNIEGGGLFNEAEGLWWRDKGFVPPYKEPNGENCYWSRGNGWVYAALVRSIDELTRAGETASNNDKESLDSMKTRLQKDFLLMSAALLKCQRHDGFWNCSLHDATNYGGKETTGTSLFVYGMAWGIQKGILDRDTYLRPVLKAWKAIVKYAVHPDGFLGFVQGTGKEPKDSQPVEYNTVPDFPDFAVGCFLLGGSQIYGLCKQ
jgi:rhamnogalacturonyl hydrolase YesR